VNHGSELPYIFGPGGGPTSPSVLTFGPILQDYWISFATSLNPNDGKGATRALIDACHRRLETNDFCTSVGPEWPKYKAERQLLELNSAGSKTVKDDFRKEQIEFIGQNWEAFAR
jgi:acetylcholinesterase